MPMSFLHKLQLGGLEAASAAVQHNVQIYHQQLLLRVGGRPDNYNEGGLSDDSRATIFSDIP